jgi:hypothetical protein
MKEIYGLKKKRYNVFFLCSNDLFLLLLNFCLFFVFLLDTNYLNYYIFHNIFYFALLVHFILFVYILCICVCMVLFFS